VEPDLLASMRLTFHVIAAVMVLVGAGIAAWRVSFIRSRRRASGEVVAVVRGVRRKSASGSTSRSQTVRVRFTAEDGTSVGVSDSMAIGEYAEGQTVTVHYDSVDPHDAVVAGLFRYWFLPAFLVALGSAFAIAAASL
jgi:hypothetical protein